MKKKEASSEKKDLNKEKSDKVVKKALTQKRKK